MKTNWQTKKLGEVCDLQNGFAFKSKDYIDISNTLNFRMSNIRPGGFVDIYHNQKFLPNDYAIKYRNFLLKDGDLVIAMTDMATETKILGMPTIVETEGKKLLLNQRVGKFFNIQNDKIYIPFLKYMLSSEQVSDYYKSLGRGGLQINIGKQDILNVKIPIPPLSEQKRIVKILDEVFEKIVRVRENTEKNLQNSKDLFESYLQSIFNNQGKNWEEKKLGDIGKPSMCKRILKHQTSPTGEIPFYKIGTFGKTPNAFISKKIYNEFRTKYSFPKKGDILISASGTIGRRVRYDGEPAFFQDSNIVWIDNDEKQVLNDYLYVFYEFCDWQPSKGATIARLYNSNLTSIKIVFPKSLEEQKEIIKKLDGLSKQTKKLEAIYKKKLEDLEELKKSVLKKAFSGEL